MRNPGKTATSKLKTGHLRKHFFDVPEVILNHIKSKNWVWRWGSMMKYNKQAGHDHRGYMAYRVPDELRVEVKPGVYAEDYQVSTDGFFHRGDMILLIIPRELNEANKQASREAATIDRNYIKRMTEDRGLSLEEAKFEKQMIKQQNELGDNSNG